MTQSPSAPVSTESIQLAPSYSIPIVLVLSALPLLLVQPWVSAAVALFGVFLLFQAATLQLFFTETALEIYRGTTLIRRFPYSEWRNWKIFWSPVPILFYFREVKSIHFLPVLFDPKMLRTALETKVPTASS